VHISSFEISSNHEMLDFYWCGIQINAEYSYTLVLITLIFKYGRALTTSLPAALMLNLRNSNHENKGCKCF
jgi:hypothetical protein